MPQDAETLISRPNPYVGPRPYRRGEILYGREKESAELADLLIAERIVMMYSPSGAGKSSLLNASLIPALEKNGFVVLPTIRLNQEPSANLSLSENFNRYIFSILLSIEESIPTEKRIPQSELARFTLKEYLKKYHERARQMNPDHDERCSLVLIFDQGEEVITIAPTERKAKQEFFNQLAETLRDRNIWCLYSLREDYLARLDSYIRPIPTGFSSRYRLRFLRAEAALSAIQKPAESQGVHFATEAAQKLTDDLRMMQVQLPDGNSSAQPGEYIEPVQLQVVCRRLWTELPREITTIELKDIQAIGTVDNALADFYALQVAAIANRTGVRERSIREWFDRKLISPQGIRSQVLKAPYKSDGLPNNVIEELEKTYLVRAEKRGGATWYELAHDRLIQPVRLNNTTWFDKNLSLFQRTADVWEQQGHSDGLLLFGKDYLAAVEWAKQNNDLITEIEWEFLSACRKLHEQNLREHRNNRIVQVLLAVSIIALVASIILYFQAEAERTRAVKAENLAQTRELAAASISTLKTDPGLSILLALEAMRNTTPPTGEAIDAMHRALPASRLERTFLGHTDRVYSVTYSPNGRHIASASLDGTVKIWDTLAEADSAFQDFMINDDPNSYGATAVSFAPHGNLLAAADGTGKIILWDTSTWQEIARKENAHSGTIWSLAFSPDGKSLATVGDDLKVIIWDTDLNPSVEFPVFHREPIQAVVFSPNGNQLATVALDGSAIIWDIALADKKFSFQIKASFITNPARMTGVIFNLDGSRLITSATDGNIYVWDALSGSKEAIMKITGHDDWVYGLLVRPASDTDSLEGEIISAGADRTIRVWGGRYGRPKLDLRGHTDQVYAIALNPQDTGLIVSASADNTIRLWDISWQGNYESFTEDIEAPAPEAEAGFLPGYAEDIDYSPDGKLLAIPVALGAKKDAIQPDYSLPGSIVLLDASTGLAAQPALQGHRASVFSVDFNSTGDRLVSASWDKTAIVWDLAANTPQPLLILEHASQVYSADYSADNRWIATGENNGTVSIWDAASGIKLHSYQPLDEKMPIQQVQFSPDASLLAVQLRENEEIFIVDTRNGDISMILSGHSDIVRDFDFTPDGSRLVSVGDDAKIILWNLAPEIPDTERKLNFDFSDHLATIYSVTFSGDGSKILSAGADGIIKVWQVSYPDNQETWSRAYTLRAYAFANDDTILDIDIDPINFEHVAAVLNDWTVRGFTLNNDELMALAEAKIHERKLTCRELQPFMLDNQYQCIP